MDVKLKTTKIEIKLNDIGFNKTFKVKGSRGLCTIKSKTDLDIAIQLFEEGNFKSETANSFPIDLRLTIESDEELCDLFLRSVVNPEHEANNSDIDFYNKLDELIKERNLYKND